MAKKDLFKQAVKNTKADKADNLANLIDSQARDKNIIIHSELKPLIPALLDEEIQLLEESIRKEGVREKIVLWKKNDTSNDYILVDGHNRYEIVQKLKKEGITVSYAFREQEFDSLEAVKYWMIINQFSRRNLTDKQRTYLMGLRYEMEKNGYGGDRKSSPKIWDLKNNDDNVRTSERLANEFNVSKNTIENASIFAKGIDKLDEELKANVLAGNVKATKSDIQKLAALELADKIDTLDKIEELIKAKPKKVNPFKKIVTQTQDQVFIVITGSWLLTYKLEHLWAEKREIDIWKIDENFEDRISLKEAIKLGVLTL
jgi:hypothetical protein